MVIVTKGPQGARDRQEPPGAGLRVADGAWSHLRLRVVRLENGPPVGYPVQFRVLGEDLAALRDNAEGIAAVMRAHPNLRNVNFDWNDASSRCASRSTRPGPGRSASPARMWR
jgi:hypothetical protein